MHFIVGFLITLVALAWLLSRPMGRAVLCGAVILGGIAATIMLYEAQPRTAATVTLGKVSSCVWAQYNDDDPTTWFPVGDACR